MYFLYDFNWRCFYIYGDCEHRATVNYQFTSNHTKQSQHDLTKHSLCGSCNLHHHLIESGTSFYDHEHMPLTEPAAHYPNASTLIGTNTNTRLGHVAGSTVSPCSVINHTQSRHIRVHKCMPWFLAKLLQNRTLFLWECMKCAGGEAQT